MKKEAFLAIFIGIVVGLGITFVIYSVRQRLTPNSQTDSLLVPSGSPAATSAEKLFITAPQNETVVTDQEITLSGNTDNQEMVVIFVNEREYVTQADNIGAFASKIQLDEGANIIQVTSIAVDGGQEVSELVVIVDPAASAESSAENDSTES